MTRIPTIAMAMVVAVHTGLERARLLAVRTLLRFVAAVTR
jgi:hypothetical protein